MAFELATQRNLGIAAGRRPAEPLARRKFGLVSMASLETACRNAVTRRTAFDRSRQLA